MIRRDNEIQRALRLQESLMESDDAERKNPSGALHRARLRDLDDRHTRPMRDRPYQRHISPEQKARREQRKALRRVMEPVPAGQNAREVARQRIKDLKRSFVPPEHRNIRMSPDGRAQLQRVMGRMQRRLGPSAAAKQGQDVAVAAERIARRAHGFRAGSLKQPRVNPDLSTERRQSLDDSIRRMRTRGTATARGLRSQSQPQRVKVAGTRTQQAVQRLRQARG